MLFKLGDRYKIQSNAHSRDYEIEEITLIKKISKNEKNIPDTYQVTFVNWENSYKEKLKFIFEKDKWYSPYFGKKEELTNWEIIKIEDL